MDKLRNRCCERVKVLGSSPMPPPQHHTAEPPNFSYDIKCSSGPDMWGALAIDCDGCQQSPINIISCKAIKIEVHATKRLKLFRWDEVPEKVVILNNGATIKMYFEYKFFGVPTICGGPLDEAYIFSDIHFHWATNCQEGSEHLINGRSGAAEVHAVFYNRKYNTIANAMLHSDGICVVGRIFDCINNTNQYLPFTSKLKNVTKFNQSYTFSPPNTFTLSSVMGPIGFEYFVYQGSLTTPPCSEAVTWLVITKNKKISIAELEEFRKLRNAKNQWMTPNFRRVQPLNGRQLWHYKR